MKLERAAGGFAALSMTTLHHNSYNLVTYNKRDFVGAERFSVLMVDAKEFLQILVDYLAERAARAGSRPEFERLLAKVPDVEPAEHDRL